MRESDLKASDVHAINLGWLIRLRWAAIGGQTLAILLVDRAMGIALPLVPLLGIVLAAALSNVALAVWEARKPEVREGLIGALIAIDVLLFSALLYLTGGPYNPFSFLYLVHIALATLVLRQAWTWGLVALSVGCFGLLFVAHRPLPVVSADAPAAPHSPAVPAPSHAHAKPMHGAPHAGDSTSEHAARAPSSHAAAAPSAHDHDMELHLYGMWIAYGVGAIFIVYFLQHMTRALAQRETELAQVRDRTAKNERLASLATLSAGAAHELATPLATIAVVAKELERQLDATEAQGALEDVQLIRAQVARCRDILSQMAADAGESAGESLASVNVAELLSEAIEPLEESSRIRLDARGAKGRTLRAPRKALAQAIRGIVKNAIEASTKGEPVEVSAGEDGARCRIEVADHGVGMPAEVRERAGEPFFTTKDTGRGMGLGLFLARALLERLGGVLELESNRGEGTRVSLVLPWQPDS